MDVTSLRVIRFRCPCSAARTASRWLASSQSSSSPLFASQLVENLRRLSLDPPYKRFHSKTTNMPSYVIEHMESDEADGTFPPWVSLEYSRMIHTCRPSQVIFSSLSRASISTLPSLLSRRGAKEDDYIADTKSVLELMKEKGIELERVCLLDPKAEKVIGIEDKDQFDWFLFGGILGDDPPRDRTGELRKLGFPGRHLGPIQMTTDTAVGVTKLVVEDQIPLDKIPFIDHPTIKFDEIESVEMPFRYVKDNKGDPLLPDGMRELLRDDMDKGFDAFDEEEVEQK